MILSDDEVQRSLAIIEDSELQAQLAKHALRDLIAHRAAGGVIPGHKVARTRARRRQWTHLGHAKKKLIEAGLSEDQICEPRRLKSPRAIERLAPHLSVTGLTWFPYRSLRVVSESSELDEAEF